MVVRLISSPTLVVIITSLIIFCPMCSAHAQGELEAILPRGSDIVGVGYKYGVRDFTPNVSAAWDLDNKRWLGKIGASFEGDSHELSFAYESWIPRFLPGYSHWNGLTVSFTAEKEFNRSITFGAFHGSVDDVSTNLVYGNYSERSYWNLSQEIRLEINGVAGKTVDSGETYSVTTVEMPIRFKSWFFLPYLGFSRGHGQIKPAFDVYNLVRGYDRGNYLGSRATAFSVEHRWPLPSQSHQSLWEAVAFVDFAAVVPADQKFVAKHIYLSAGTGLSLNLGVANFNLVYVCTGDQENKVMFFGNVL